MQWSYQELGFEAWGSRVVLRALNAGQVFDFGDHDFWPEETVDQALFHVFGTELLGKTWTIRRLLPHLAGTPWDASPRSQTSLSSRDDRSDFSLQICYSIVATTWPRPVPGAY